MLQRIVLLAKASVLASRAQATGATSHLDQYCDLLKQHEHVCTSKGALALETLRSSRHLALPSFSREGLAGGVHVTSHDQAQGLKEVLSILVLLE